MNLQEDETFKKAFTEATKNLTKEQAGKMVVWFIFVTVMLDVIVYGVASWLTLFAVNVLWGPVVAVEFPQVIALAWILYMINWLTNKVIGK